MLDAPGVQLQRLEPLEKFKVTACFCDEEKRSAGGFRRAPQRLMSVIIS